MVRADSSSGASRTLEGLRGAVEIDREGFVRECDDAAAQLLGVAAADVVGRNLYADLAPNTDMPGFRGRVLHGFRGPQVEDRFTWILPRGDALITTEISIAPAKTPQRRRIEFNAKGPRPRPVEEERALELARARAALAVTESPVATDDRYDPCAREPIHLVAAIQPHGCLVVVDPATMTVVSASSNLADFLASEAEAALGAPLASLLDPILVDTLATRLRAASAIPGHRLFSTPYPIGGRPGRLSAHVADGVAIVELEAVWADHDPLALDEAARITALLEAVDDEAELIAVATREIAALTGFHRVLFHRFDEDGDGEVVAEALADGSYEPLLGLRFPAGDIPSQARALYVRSRFRWMPDTNYAPVPLHPPRLPGSSQPLDLGWSALRSQSAVHRIYQRNLGVAAGFSASVVIDGDLFGLIVGHNSRPRFVDSDVRSAIEVISRVLETRLDALLRRRAATEPPEIVSLRAAILARVRAADDWAEELCADSGALRLLDATGCVLADGADLRLVGATPPRPVLHQLVDALRPLVCSGVFATHHAGAHFPALLAHTESASGLLALSLGGEGSSLLVWFRPERIHPVHWIGDTNKETVAGPHGERIRLPRSSFRRVIETRRGYAEPWPAWAIATARALESGLVDALVGHARALRRINAEHATLRAAQLAFFSTVNHQLRSPLNGVLGAAGQLRRLASLDPVARDLVERLERAGRGLESMIGDILDFTELAGGRFELRSTPFAAARLFAEFEALVAARLPPGLDFELDVAVDASLGDFIGDRARVLQAVANLAVDAVDASPDRRVQVRVRPLRPTGLIIEVEDQHHALARGATSHSFDPYAAAATPSAEGLPSKGLRLPLTRALVLAMGGALRIVALAGGGSLCTLELPLPEAQRAAPAPPATTRPLRVLVVDDGELNVLILAAILGDLGHLVETAADGAQAVARAHDRRFDVILMDKHMPIMDGVEAMRRIRALPGDASTTPIYMVSADAHCEIGGGGFDGYIAKPLDPAAVERALGEVTDRAQGEGSRPRTPST